MEYSLLQLKSWAHTVHRSENNMEALSHPKTCTSRTIIPFAGFPQCNVELQKVILTPMVENKTTWCMVHEPGFITEPHECRHSDILKATELISTELGWLLNSLLPQCYWQSQLQMVTKWSLQTILASISSPLFVTASSILSSFLLNTTV